jgi:hypothetical protein
MYMPVPEVHVAETEACTPTAVALALIVPLVVIAPLEIVPMLVRFLFKSIIGVVPTSKAVLVMRNRVAPDTAKLILVVQSIVIG